MTDDEVERVLRAMADLQRRTYSAVLQAHRAALVALLVGVVALVLAVVL